MERLLVSKNGTRDFQNSPPFERSALEILKIFDTLTLKQIFWQTKTSFKKLDRFSVGSTKIENAAFPCKTALPEADINSFMREVLIM